MQCIHGLSPEIMNDIFSAKVNIYNKWHLNVFLTQILTLNRHELNSVLYKANLLWNFLAKHVRLSPSLTPFKNETKLSEFLNCPCNICSTQLIFVLHPCQFLILIRVLILVRVLYINIWWGCSRIVLADIYCKLLKCFKYLCFGNIIYFLNKNCNVT